MQFTMVSMEVSNGAPADAASSSSSSSHSHTASSSNDEGSGAASSSIIDPRVEEEETEDIEAGHAQLIQQRTSLSYNAHFASRENEENLQLIRNDTWSCLVVIVTFCSFVSMTMIFGVYGSSNILLGPNTSILIRSNPAFVEYLKVEELEKASNHPTMYGFYRTPPLDVVTSWPEAHKAFLPPRSHEEWVYYLNQGSQMNISYSVNSPGSSLIFVIAQGKEGLSQWLEDPSHPSSSLSWNTVHGNGMIQQDIDMSYSYYVAVANLNAEAVEVSFSVQIRALLYNTTGAYYKCSLSRGQCNIELSFNGGNYALLTSPGATTGRGGDQWYVKLSHGPRWMTYIAAIGTITVLMFVAFRLLNDFECTHGRRVQYGDTQSERTPLLVNKDDDLSSWGSSYDSVSQDDEDHEDAQAIGSLEAKSTKDGEYNNIRRLCAICFDAPRDCFFLPCGHCVACFACGTRIAEAAGTCPICRRDMKKVRKIFTV